MRHLTVLQQVIREPVVEARWFGPEEVFTLFGNVDALLESNAPLHAALARLQVRELFLFFIFYFNSVKSQSFIVTLACLFTPLK